MTMEFRIDFEAQDLLYFGDGRQADGSTPGNGANWPLPSVMNSALIHAMHRNLEEEVGAVESVHVHKNKLEEKKAGTVRFSFGGVQTIGPFPVVSSHGMLYPIPADLQMGRDKELAFMRLIENDGGNNLPAPLTKMVAPVLPPSKETPGGWLTLDGLKAYMQGIMPTETIPSSEIYDTEHRVGIGIDSESQTCEDGKFYTASYMRFLPGAMLRVYASYMAAGFDGKNRTDMMATAMEKGTFNRVILGGQMGVARQREMVQEGLELPSCNPTRHLKWVLLTPACFRAGWKPGFVDATTGNIRLKQEVERGNLPRDEWRRRINLAPEIQAKLVAARIPKHATLSGWKLSEGSAGQPKSTKRLVPAGSVYYFECIDDANAAMLARALHANTHSDEYGEQGFGFGFCTNWNNQR